MQFAQADIMHPAAFFQNIIEEELNKISFKQQPSELYDPIRYMLSQGGKRLRPTLLLMANELFGGDVQKAKGPALGLEIFHNFTLLHDDIMDKAPLRRSNPTVHKRWNTDIAILSGDAMFVKSCQFMMHAEEKFSRQVMEVFLAAAIQVCEGQQMDMNFETQQEVSIENYIRMITLKTAVLLGCSMRIGTLLAGGSEQDSIAMNDFGVNLGIAFQLNDDYLDVYGDEKKFGKQIGGDIIANKKTFLLLTALEHAGDKEKQQLLEMLENKNSEPAEKVSAVKKIYLQFGIREKTETEMKNYFHRALKALDEISVDSSRKILLIELAEKLMKREN